MYIYEIIIDGFKSYAHRTTIGPFDPQFNAITGLNGSGKSNILDAICFVLGISNLSQVRVSNLQQLIYKKGQAGVRKASVSIVFNNGERETSPPGFEHCPTITVTRQVAVGGRTKYLINGHVKQQSQVQDLFRSVQLNVNNPHFLIMQGRITKVLNMKAPEVLGMLAEAAGVMLYEAKKIDARKTIAKKQVRVDEITKVLVEDITPTLETLTKQQKNYDLWNKVKMELEALQRYLIAYDFFRASEFLKKGGKEREKDLERLEEMKKRVEEAQEELVGVVEELEGVRGGGELREGEKEVASLSKDVVSLEGEVKYDKEAVGNEKNVLKGLMGGIKEVEGNVKAMEEVLEEKKKGVEELEGEKERWNGELEEAQRGYQAASTGMIVTKDGEDKTITQELMEKKRVMVEGEAQIKEFQMRHRHLKGSLVEKKKMVKKGNKSEELEGRYEREMNKLNGLQQKILDIQFNPEEECRLRGDLGEEEEKAKGWKRKVGDLRVEAFDFKYSSPSGGFDRAKVKGMVGTLVNIKDLKGATALEVGAGGRLYQVVVDDEMTAKALLEKGQLKRRVTIIPLNKIDQSSLSGDKLRRAEGLVGKENATVALEYVDYDGKVGGAMKYVFGKFFVCKDSQSAKVVTFDKNILAKSVTLDGDVYDPSGTITGGSRAQSGGNLVKMAEYNQAKKALMTHEANAERLKIKLSSMGKAKGAYKEVEREIGLCNHQVELLRESLNQTEYQRLAFEVEGMEKEVVGLEGKLKQKKEEIQEAKERIASLEEEMNSAPKSKEELVKKAQERVKEVKKKMGAVTKEYKVAVNEMQKVEFEISELRGELDSLRGQKETTEANIEKLKEKLVKSTERLEETKKEFREKNKKMGQAKEQLAQAISELEPAKKELEKELGDLSEKIQKLEHKISSFEKDRRGAEQTSANILKEHKWVAEEKHLFNRPKSRFDFAGKDIGEVREKVKKLREQEAKLAGSINKKVKDMIDTAEDKYKVLKERIDILERDKRSIEASIMDLDKKKNEALENAFGKVNKDMGKIFETLLPGAVAKLEAVREEEGCVLIGLEVKVAFGGVWKESLSELSGGQRSLLALSLILSILLFKPAPMYVLDEIDAALDLSHTQNIGQIIRTHFSKSQFVIVSLKEGMFNNANCLFRVKGVNGISQVTRTAKKKK